MIKRRNLDPELVASLGVQNYLIPDAASTTWIEAATSVDGVDLDLAASDLDKQPDIARQIIFTFVDADTSIEAGSSITIVGRDQFGIKRTETLAVDTDGGLTYATSYAYSFIESIKTSLTGNSTGDTLAVGTNTAFGTPWDILSTDEVIAVLVDGVDDLTAGGVINATYNTYTPNTAPDGSKTFRFAAQV